MNVVYFDISDGRATLHLQAPDLGGFPAPTEGQSAILLEGGVELPGYVENSNYYQLTEPPSSAFEFNYFTKQWEDPRTLDDFKADKWATVKAARDAREFGPFSWGALTFDGDAESKSRLSLAAMAAQAAIASGQAADVIGVVQAMGANITAAHQAARLKRAAIEAATTVEELDAI